MINRVIKRDGTVAPYDEEKVNKAPMWAVEGLHCSASTIVLKAAIEFTDDMTTDRIHAALINSARNLISEENPDYQIATSRLAVFLLRKQLFGSFDVPHLKTLAYDMVDQGRYDSEVVASFTNSDWDVLEAYIDHNRDMDMRYATFLVLQDKYIIRDKNTGILCETPQQAMMMMCATFFHRYTPDRNYTAEQRLDFICRLYDVVSLGKASFPTPINAGMRGVLKQFSSCVCIEMADTLTSINAGCTAANEYASARAGLGINMGAIRALGSSIRHGEVIHSGLVPFVKQVKTSIKSVSQGGIRDCAGTVYFTLWHQDIQDLLVLKNNRGVEDNRERHLDYAIQINTLLYRRLIEGKDISLFSPSAVPGLYEAFFADSEKFSELYLAAEANPVIKRNTVKASELFTLLASERAGTGRIYIQNVDHCNQNSPFIASIAPIRQSNLCLEIALPTTPITEKYNPESGEIALCTLAAFNYAVIESLEEMDEVAELIVRALNELLDYQDYPHKAAVKSGKGRRPLGVGGTGLATYIAKNGARYSDGSANDLVHALFERQQYALLKASNLLAKEDGACDLYNETTYSQGILPIDRYCKNVDGITKADLLCDWESLREDIGKWGLRNSTLTALMPCETSAQMTCTPNGIEPARAGIMVKVSKDKTRKPVVFEKIDPSKGAYEFLWDIKSNRGYLGIVAIAQKFIDQSISANTNYDPANYPENKLPIKLVLQDILYANKLGIKTLYYHNTNDGSTKDEIEADDGCAGGACKI